VRGNRPTDPDWAASLEPGWQRRRIENFTILTSGGLADEDLVMDGWTDIIGKLLVAMRQDDADFRVASPDGATALRIALARNDKVLVELLRRAGAVD